MSKNNNKKITVNGTEAVLYKDNKADFISLTDIARYRDTERSDYILQNWMRNRSTIEFIGLWEKFNNPDFNSIEFDGIKNMAGSNSFSLTPKRWIETTKAIGIVSKTGRYGGTFAHKDIAFEFASWLSAEFKFFLIKEKLIPDKLTRKQTNIIYATEADILNMALFGKTARYWREANPEKSGNIRDYANVSQLVCLSNLENINALFIKEEVAPMKRLKKLNTIAIEQMKMLVENKLIKKIGS